MDQPGYDKARVMKASGTGADLGDATATEYAKTAEQIIDDATTQGTRESPDSGHPAPEALAGWLAA